MTPASNNNRQWLLALVGGLVCYFVSEVELSVEFSVGVALQPHLPPSSLSVAPSLRPVSPPHLLNALSLQLVSPSLRLVSPH